MLSQVVLPNITGSTILCGNIFLMFCVLHCLNLKEAEVTEYRKVFDLYYWHPCQLDRPSNHQGSWRRYAWRRESHSKTEPCCQPQESSYYSSKWPDWVSYPPGRQGQIFKFVQQDNGYQAMETNWLPPPLLLILWLFVGSGSFWNKFQLHLMARTTPLWTFSIRLRAPF